MNEAVIPPAAAAGGKRSGRRLTTLRAQIGGVLVDRLDRQGWARRLADTCRARGVSDPPLVCLYANGQTIVEYARNHQFRELFDQADAITADGQSIVIASRLSPEPLPERVAVTDCFHDACEIAEREGLSFYFLATTVTNIEAALDYVRSRYPRLKIAGYRSGYFTADEEAGIVEAIRKAQPDVLWLGLGMPRQERFAFRYKSSLQGVGWLVASGGLFDHLVPGARRAPRWMQELSLEWLHRALREPHKYLKRYVLTNGPAAWLLLTRTDRR